MHSRHRSDGPHWTCREPLPSALPFVARVDTILPYMPAPTGLADSRHVSHATLWSTMRKLLDRVSAVSDRADVLDDCLDIVVDLLDADRGLVVLVQSDGATHVVRARGARGAVSVEEREEISRTIVRDALADNRCVIWDRDEHGSTSQSTTSLGILAALAAPIHAPMTDDTRGVLYVDFRDPRKFVEAAHIEFFMAAVVLIGAVLEQRSRMQVDRAQLEEARSRCIEVRQSPVLADLLAFDSMAAIREELASALTSDSPILILGESGTGKTVLAQAIAEASHRRPVVRVVLGGSDDLNTIASELFGHERGSFSGAAGKRIGMVEFAKGGTLIFDELLNLPLHAQKLLLDFTQFGAYRPLGHERPAPKVSQVRIIAATNGDLQAAIRDGRFREDLYYRLAAVTLHVPPLRERREDLPALAESALRSVDPSRGWKLTLALRKLLVSPRLDWPGNVRQFERVIQRSRERALARDPKCASLDVEHLESREVGLRTSSSPPPVALPHDATPASQWQRIQEERAALEAREKESIRDALARHAGVVAHVAKELGIPRTTLASRLEALGIQRRG